MSWKTPIIIIEPTNRCNLNCRTCIRNVWHEPLGRMAGSAHACRCCIATPVF